MRTIKTLFVGSVYQKLSILTDIFAEIILKYSKCPFLNHSVYAYHMEMDIAVATKQ